MVSLFFIGKKMYKILIDGIFDVAQLQASLRAGMRTYPDYIEKIVAEAWGNVPVGVDIFDGCVYCLIDYTCTNNVLSYTLQASTYRYFYGTNVSRGHIRANEADYANSLAVCSVVETSDNLVYLGLRSTQLAEQAGLWHTAAGNIDTYSTNPAFDTIFAELKEELGVNKNVIEKCLCLGLVKNMQNLKPEFIFYTRLKINAEELLARISKAVDCQEHTRHQFVEFDNLEKFLADNAICPSGLACFQEFISKRRRQIL